MSVIDQMWGKSDTYLYVERVVALLVKITFAIPMGTIKDWNERAVDKQPAIHHTLHE